MGFKQKKRSKLNVDDNSKWDISDSGRAIPWDEGNHRVFCRADRVIRVVFLLMRKVPGMQSLDNHDQRTSQLNLHGLFSSRPKSPYQIPIWLTLKFRVPASSSWSRSRDLIYASSQCGFHHCFCRLAVTVASSSSLGLPPTRAEAMQSEEHARSQRTLLINTM